MSFRLCSTDNTKACCHFDLRTEFNLTQDYTPTEIRATFIDETRIYGRIVNESRHAAVTFLIWIKSATMEKCDIGIKTAPDHKSFSDLSVVYAFTEGRHSYFIGTATRQDLPYSILNPTAHPTYKIAKTGARARTNIVFSRLCTNELIDERGVFESRIDITLECRGTTDRGIQSRQDNSRQARAN